MMRKISQIGVASLALIAFVLAFSAPALAEHDPENIVHDPSCEGGAPLEVRGFGVTTTATSAYTVTGVTGKGLACGSEAIFGGGGEETLIQRADITVPAGWSVKSSTDVPDGSYAGNACVDSIIYLAPGFPVLLDEATPETDPDFCLASELKVDNAEIGGQCPADAISCLKGEARDEFGTVLGFNWNWTTLSADGQSYTLTIGEEFNGLIPGELAALTEIEEFTLCPRFGAAGFAPGEGQCGDSADDPWQQKSGDPFSAMARTRDLGKDNDVGLFTVTATQRGGAVSPEAKSRVRWSGSCTSGLAGRLAGPGSHCTG